MALAFANAFIGSSKKNYFYVGFLLVVFSHFGTAQTSFFRRVERKLGVNDGLNNRHLNTTFVDKENKIWFLTDNQLSKFEYGNVRTRAVSTDFSNRGFNYIVEDALGNFWVSECVEWFYPFNVVKTLLFNPKTQRTITAQEYLGNRLKIHSLVADNQGNIFIGTKNGHLFLFDVRQKKLTLKLKLDAKPVKILYAGLKGWVLCIENNAKTDQQLLYFSTDGKLLKSETLQNTFVRKVVETENDLIVFYQVQQKKIILQSIISTKKYSLPASKGLYLWNLRYDSSQKMLVLSALNSLTFLNGDFQLITKESFDAVIHDFCIDSFNNYVLATNDGLQIVNLSEKKITTYLTINEPENSHQYFSCRGILQINQDELVVNTNKKRQLINLRTHQVKPLYEFKNEIAKTDRFVLGVMKDKEGNLLFSEDGLVNSNLKTGRDEVWCSLDSTKIWALEEYKNGILLGLEKKGVVFYDKQTKKTRIIKALSHVFSNAIIYDFYVENNVIYIAAENGFYQLKNERELRKIIFKDNDTAQRMCFHLSKDPSSSSSLLIATSNGIWKYYLDRQHIEPFLLDTALLTRKFLSVYRAKNGVWASSEQGVWRFDSKGTLLKIYTEADGLTSNECNRLAHYHNEVDDQLYFGGINGLNVLNTSAMSDKKEGGFDFLIDSILVYAGNQLQRTISTFKHSTLQLDENEQSVEFRLWYEDFKYQCPKHYYYRTNEPTEKEWRLINNRFLLLNNINYGKTEVEIRVVSCNDFINAQTVNLRIIRAFPFYMKWYFWLGVVAGLLVVIWGAIKLSNHQLQKRNVYLRQKVDEQTLSLRESLEHRERLLRILIHDVRYPVQSFYELSRKLDFLIRKQDTQRLLLLGKETEERSRKVLWLIDELVLWVKSSNQNWHIHKEDRSLNQLVQQILESYKEEIDEKKLTIQISEHDMMANLDSGLMTIVFRNLLFNAIVYSPLNTEIKIEFGQVEKSNYSLKIVNRRDPNNIGSDKGLGLGLSLLNPLLEKANIRLESRIFEDVYIVNVRF